MKTKILGGLLACALTNAIAQEVAVTTAWGNQFTLEVADSDTFFEITDQIRDCLCEEEGQEIFFGVRKSSWSGKTPVFAKFVNAVISSPRDYFSPVNQEERDAMHYVVMTLSNKSLARLLLLKGSLDRAGSVIDKVHPLRFVQCIFADEEMKAGIHNIRAKGRVWREFYDGVRNSLQVESTQGNIRPEFVKSFCESLSLSYETVWDAVSPGLWQDFFDILFEQIPRAERHHRYDS